MGGKSDGGDYNVLQGGVGQYVADPVPPTATATSGATEPAWPAVEGGVVSDGGITWTAILARVAEGTVTGVLNPATFQHDLTAYPSHYFQYGTVTWLTGDNAGFSCDIRDALGSVATAGGSTPPYIYMLEIAPNPIQVGDAFQAT